jgi:glycosyltransferase involved in cell wall biosynthesis
MKILMVHAFYKLAGGEDSVFRNEVELLRSRGHDVREFTRSNSEMDGLGALAQFRTTIHNSRAVAEFEAEISSFSPDIVHVHNTFQILSPSVLQAASRRGIPVVQTLHNYRLQCVNGLFFRDGKVCEECLGRVPVPGVRHGCYRESKAASAAVATMLTVHRAKHTYDRAVTRLICLTEFARSKMIDGGLPADRIDVKPNFLATDPGTLANPEGYGLFVGRISEEKGIDLLLDAWDIAQPGHELRVAGDGPLREDLAKDYGPQSSVRFLGSLSREQVQSEMRGASYLVLPSVWYEGLPMVLVEALAVGLPVIVPRLGALPEIGGGASIVFEAGNVGSLADRLHEVDEDSSILDRLRPIARQTFEDRYTADRNYDMLMKIYDRARSEKGT